MKDDTERLMFVMSQIDGFVNVKKDKYEYAAAIAQENGRDEPNAQDQLDGIRVLVDMASSGFCHRNNGPCESPKTCASERSCLVASY